VNFCFFISDSLNLTLSSLIINCPKNTEGYKNDKATNPLDKLLEAIEENKKLYNQLLASEKEKITILQRMLDDNR
jgi:hypothetical protein